MDKSNPNIHSDIRLATRLCMSFVIKQRLASPYIHILNKFV